MSGIDTAIGLFTLLAMLLSFSGKTIGESALAFGGDRWTDSNAPFYMRITARGWAALLCLFVAGTLVSTRKDTQRQALIEKTSTIVALEENAARLQAQIKNYVTDIVKLQEDLKQARESLADTDRHIETHQLQSIEAAFKLTGKLDQDIDTAVVHLDGRPRIPIPSRHLAQMRPAGGNRFYFATFLQNPTFRDLESVQLEMGKKRYALFEGSENGFFEKTLRLPGNPFRTVPAFIQNPRLLNDMTLKIILRPKEITLEEDPFRQLVLNSPFSEAARKKYKTTTADILNIRSEASASSRLVERLPRGAYVQVLKQEKKWVEILTPKGLQGWVMDQFLSGIQ
ncbi:MAG: SH3 domain-containing protein [Nitrospiria bacterium]